MKHFIIILLICFAFFKTEAQKQKNYFINEFNISVIKSDVADINTENRVGVGVGIYHYSIPTNIINLITGIEVSNNSQFKKSEYDGHFGGAKNITYKFYNLTLQFAPRILFGKRTKYFLAIGPFLNIPLYGYKVGTYSFYDTSILQYKTENKRQKFSDNFNLGALIGVGLIHTFNKRELYIKPEYKLAFTNKYDMDYFHYRYISISLGLRLINNK